MKKVRTNYEKNIDSLILDLNTKLDQINKKIDYILQDMECYAYQTQLLNIVGMNREGESILDTKKRFFRLLSVTDPYMLLKQKGSLLLLKRFINICEQRKLRYWVSYGALLGAVRHSGFIPWDDDIDVCMPRKDYEELLRVADDEDFQTVFWYHVKGAFRIKKLIFRNHKNDWFLDIFPFEESTISPKKAKDVYKQYKRILLDNLKDENVILYDCWIEKETLDRIKNIYDTVCTSYLAELSHTKITAQNPATAQEHQYTQVPTTDQGHYRAQAQQDIVFVNPVDGPEINLERNGYILPIEDVFPCKTLIFAQQKINVMNNYQRFLEEFYGDYMSLPKDIYTHQHVKNTVSAQYIAESEEFLKEITIRREL